jgi:hypothetical protein
MNCSKVKRSTAWICKKFHAKILVLDCPAHNCRIDLQRVALIGKPSRSVRAAPSGGVLRVSILHPPVERSYRLPVPLALPEKVTGMSFRELPSNAGVVSSLHRMLLTVQWR